MTYTIVGLGNPGEKYKNTRHNVGRIILEFFAKRNDFPSFEKNKKNQALTTESKINKKHIMLIEPELFMNNSGKALTSLIKSKKQAENTVVIYDDIDLPIGTFRIAYNRGSGGHRGIESVTRFLKTKKFIRVRVGISQATPSGKIKKPVGEKKVVDYLMGDFTEKEQQVLKKESKKIIEALEVILKEGYSQAMNEFN